MTADIIYLADRRPPRTDEIEAARFANEVVALVCSGMRLRDAIEAAYRDVEELGAEEMPVRIGGAR